MLQDHPILWASYPGREISSPNVAAFFFHTLFLLLPQLHLISWVEDDTPKTFDKGTDFVVKEGS